MRGKGPAAERRSSRAHFIVAGCNLAAVDEAAQLREHLEVFQVGVLLRRGAQGRQVAAQGPPRHRHERPIPYRPQEAALTCHHVNTSASSATDWYREHRTVKAARPSPTALARDSSFVQYSGSISTATDERAARALRATRGERV